MWFPRVFQAFEGNDFLSNRVRNGHLARPHRTIVHEHSASAALPYAATKARIVQFQIVAKDIQKGTFRVHVHFVHPAIYFQGGSAHMHLTTAIVLHTTDWRGVLA